MPAQRFELRVRYAESDQMGVAHHGAYVAWFEAARIEWLRAHGQSYRELEAQGVLLPVFALSIEYQRAVRFDDVLDLTTDAHALGPSRLRFTTVLRLAGDPTPRATGTVTLATVNRDGRPIRLPAVLAALLPASG
jgi:acyl-CoA thioester hydrolase